MTPPVKRGRGRPRKNPPAGSDPAPPPKRKIAPVSASSGSASSGSASSGPAASGSASSWSQASVSGTVAPGSSAPRTPASKASSAPTTTSTSSSSAATPTETPNTSPESSAASSGSGTGRKPKVPFSNVHRHFEQTCTGTDPNGNRLWTSKCKYCPPGPLGAYGDKAASHLKQHLQTNHPEIHKMVEDEDDKDRETRAMKELAKDKQGRALNKFLDWIAFSGLPLSTSNDPYFIEFYKELNDQVALPGRKGTTRLLVDVKFRAMYQKLLALLERVRVVHTTTDMWSNFRLRSSYIGFTGHMFDPLTRTRVCVRLALRPFNSAHTARNIIDEATKIFEELGIMQKVNSCIFILYYISNVNLHIDTIHKLRQRG